VEFHLMRLSRYLSVMAIFLLAVAGLAAWLIGRLEGAFRANPILNAVLIAVWLIGVIYIFTQTLRLSPAIRWVQSVQRNRLAASELDPPPLLGSLARLIEYRKAPLALTPQASRAVLDGIAVRLDESRETARYFVGLLIFLGLLGTFWGLLKTVGSVGGVVNGLSVTADPTELFANLKAGLQGPLDGMGTAFGSSLLGLAGSLALGFLDLQMGHAQSRFFVDLEDWLFATSAGGGAGLGEDAPPEAMLRTLIEQTALNIDHFQRVVGEAEEGRRQSAAAIQALAQHVGQLAQAQDRGWDAVSRSAEITAAAAHMLDRMDQALAQSALGDGHIIRAHLGAIDSTLSRIAEILARAQAESEEDMRGEMRRLARALGITRPGI
jgi:hypothetical protein